MTTATTKLRPVRGPDAGLSRYIERVRSIPVLSREAEHDLAVRARAGDRDAADALVHANLRYVVAAAIQYRRYGLRLADLVAEGNLGLMMAVRKFDPDRGTRFVTYAGYWIRAYVLDHIVRSASLVGGGTGALRSKVFFRLRRERARIANLVADDTERNEQLAARFGVTPEKVEAMVRRLDGHDVSLDARPYHDSKSPLVELLPGHEEPQDEAVFEAEREDLIREQLGPALESLDRRERFIVEHRIMSDEEMSLAAIGRELGVSRERARQLEARAKKKLRDKLESFDLELASGWA